MKKSQSFGKYILYFDPPTLMEGRRKIPLSKKHLQTLALIVRGRGRTIARAQFRQDIWQNSYIEDGNLTQAIFILRKALGKLPDGTNLIETIPGVGYRLASAAFRPAYAPQGESGPAGGESSVPPQMGDAEQLRLLVDSIEGYAIYMLDCAGRVLTWNSGAEKNKGYGKSEVLGKHFSMFFVPEDMSSRVPDRQLARAMRAGRVEGEGWRLRKCGERFWASFTITTIRNRSGKIVGFGKVVRDLSERKKQEDLRLRMEATLRRERDRLESAAESSMDALCICDAVRSTTGEIEDFVLTYLNSNVEKMVSIPRDVLLGGRMCEMLPANREQGLFSECAKVLETGNPYIAEFSIEAVNLMIRRIRIRAVALQDGIAISVSDISGSTQKMEPQNCGE